VVLAVLPGLPTFPFLLLGAAAGGLAWRSRRARERAAAVAPRPDQPAGPQEEPITSALAMDAVRLELGYGLLGLIGDGRGARLPDQIKALRRQLAAELGFVMPSARIQDNIQLPANSYVVRLKEMEVARGDIRAAMLLVMDPQGRPIALPGEPTTEPTFGLDAMWVVPGLRDQAALKGYTVVDPATVVTTHLTEVVRENLADLLSYAETQNSWASSRPSTRSSWASWSRTGSPPPASSACFRGCSPSASRSATCRSSSRRSARRSAGRRTSC
jgi:flagellar biosynthesis protein FlhA